MSPGTDLSPDEGPTSIGTPSGLQPDGCWVDVRIRSDSANLPANRGSVSFWDMALVGCADVLTMKKPQCLLGFSEKWCPRQDLNLYDVTH